MWEFIIKMRETAPVPTPIAPDSDPRVRAERFRTALQPRILGRAGLGAGGNYRALLLERGTAMHRTGHREERLASPSLAWFPWTDDMRLTLLAGAQGIHLLMDRAALDRALRLRPEAEELRFLADRPALARLADSGDVEATVAACFRGILSETGTPGSMAQAVVDSFLHILLVQLFRALTRQDPALADAGGGRALADRFTALVEGHFREQWTAERYARALGVSRDRLNDISQRAFGRAPGDLIRSRLHLEARRYLETSSYSVDQIAGILGFSGAPQFNRFFKTRIGEPPGRYRARHLRVIAEGATPIAEPYAWP